jgi:hypothetical protein
MNIINQIQKKKWLIYFVIYLRYLIGGAMVFSSIVKIKGLRFTTADGILAPINSANHFFETLYQSGLYWQFLGWSQLIAGLILMTQRYATLGALVLFPIIVNIFVITLSYYFAGTPIITGLLLLANIFLILWVYQKYLPLFSVKFYKEDDSHQIKNEIESSRLWAYLGLLLFLLTIIYVLLFKMNILYWFVSCVIIGLIGLGVWKKNNLIGYTK